MASTLSGAPSLELEQERAAGLGAAIHFSQVTWENIFPFSERGKYWADLGFFFEFGNTTLVDAAITAPGLTRARWIASGFRSGSPKQPLQRRELTPLRIMACMIVRIVARTCAVVERGNVRTNSPKTIFSHHRHRQSVYVARCRAQEGRFFASARVHAFVNTRQVTK